MDKIKLKLKDKTIYLLVDDFDNDEVEVDKLLQIDYRNLIKEVITFSVIFNKWGMLLAEAENKVQEAELDYRIWRAKKNKDTREVCDAEKIKVTNQVLEDAMRQDVKYMIHYKKVNSAKKTRDYVNSIYWSAKLKSDLLQKLSLSLQTAIQNGEIDEDDIFGHFNGVDLVVKR